MRLSEASEILVRLGSDFHRRGWVLGTSGNLSAVISRDPLRLAMTPSSVDKGRLSSSQILELDQAGQVVGTAPGKPSAETLLHTTVIRATGAAAVLHTHSVWGTVLSDVHGATGGLWIEGYEMLKGLDGVETHEHREWLPILENSQDMSVLSRQAEELLRVHPEAHGFLVRRHGLYTWGRDLAAAARHVEILEFLLESFGRRQMMEPQS